MFSTILVQFRVASLCMISSKTFCLLLLLCRMNMDQSLVLRGGRETSVLFSFFLVGGGGSSDNGKICRFHWNNFLTYCKYAGTGRQAGGKVMLMLKIHIYYIFNMLCSMFLLSVLELVAAPARTQLAMTFLECLSSSSVTLNLLHMHIQYLKTSKL